MKRKSYAILAIMIVLQLLLSGMVTVNAEGDSATAIGEAYTAPESPAITYNMNLDWKFYDTQKYMSCPVQEAWESAKKDGKQFYEVGYNDSEWETVSIPHGINGEDAFTAATKDAGGGMGRLGVFLYRKEFTVPAAAAGGKVFFEMEGIRQSAYVWVNGQKVGYYEAGIAAFGFDLTKYVTPGETALIAIANDCSATSGNSQRYAYETVPGDSWGSSYTPDNFKTSHAGESGIVGTGYQWNVRSFNETQAGLVYDAYLHITGGVYQTFPLYNNLKTTGNYIYADNFDIRAGKATINVDAEIRNESANDGKYTLEVAVVDHEGNLAYEFESKATTVAKASDTDTVYETAVENDVYTDSKLPVTTELDGVANPSLLDQINDSSKRPYYTPDVDKNGNHKYYTYNENWTEWASIPSGFEKKPYDDRGYRYEYRDSSNKIVSYDSPAAKQYRLLLNVYQIRHNESFATEVITPDVTHITASYEASDVRFWTDTDPYLYTVYTILRDADGNAVDVQKKETGFRKVTYDANQGVLINDKPVWLKGYAQRSTNEWAVIGVATDWLQDYDMALLKSNNSNFIRWMHVAPKPAEVRSSDRYGVIVVCPAGDKEGDVEGRSWSQRAEAMRDAMIYFRNSPSILFWETGNSAINAPHAKEMAALRDDIDPKGMRFIGARSTRNAPDQLNYEYNYAGTMYGGYASDAKAAMTTNKLMGPIMETEYAREESPRRVWDDYSPPDYDYVNKTLTNGKSKEDGYDAHDRTQEDITVSNIREYNGYYSNRAGHGSSLYSAEAMMVWSDSNMHGRNSGSENCRTSGRVDPIRQTKEMYEGTRVAHSDEPAVHIIGHWSYPQYGDDTYNYFEKTSNGTYAVYNKNKKSKRDPFNKTVYVIGSVDVTKVELYRLDGEEETLLGTDDTADSTFIYQFDKIDVTQGDGVIAKAYNARGEEVATDEIARTGDAVSIRLTPHTSVKDVDGETVDYWKADGADIAYFDVEVVDAKGNVCALNYDRINFTWSGEGEYLGGYNSGMGAGCFPNSMESEGLSFYFDGIKDNSTTIRKPYVYAENGTNRIFVKSTRTAGTFTLTANMDISGMAPVSAQVTSVPVEMDSETGLTLEMPSHLKPGLSSDRPTTSNVAPMKPLLDKFVVDWSKVKIEKEVDTNVYYTVLVNGTELALAGNMRARTSTMDNGAYGPIAPVLDALGISYTKNADGTELIFTASGTEYTIRSGSNQLYWGSESNETIDGASMTDGELFVHYNGVFQYVNSVNVSTDKDNHTVNITAQ